MIDHKTQDEQTRCEHDHTIDCQTIGHHLVIV